MKTLLKALFCLSVIMATFLIWKKTRECSQSSATVIDPQKIAKSRFDYVQTEATMKERQVNFQASAKEYKRLKSLHAQDGIISDKTLEQALTLAKSDYAKWQVAKADFLYHKESLTLRWGKQVAEWIAGGGVPYKEIIAQTKLLIQVHMPKGMDLAGLPKVHHVKTPLGKSLAAQLISSTPHVDCKNQTLSLFYTLQENNSSSLPGNVAHLETK